MDIQKILVVLRPGEEWTLRGSTLDDLEWHSNTPKPTKEELEVGEQQLNELAYREQRAPSYPQIGDQLDALWKGGEAAAEMLKRIQAVKEKFPKPL